MTEAEAEAGTKWMAERVSNLRTQHNYQVEYRDDVEPDCILMWILFLLT